MSLRIVLAAAVALVALAAIRPAAAQTAPPAVASPCADSLYQVLRGKGLEALTEREYEYFKQREKACVEYQQLRSLVDRPREAAATPRRDAPLATETYTQANTMSGVDVYIRNLSDVPVIVNSVEVYDCQNLRSNSCGLHHPKTRIQPRQSRRVLTIRFGNAERSNGYRYRYHVTAEATPEG